MLVTSDKYNELLFMHTENPFYYMYLETKTTTYLDNAKCANSINHCAQQLRTIPDFLCMNILHINKT